jgi:hypothetical protein
MIVAAVSSTGRVPILKTSKTVEPLFTPAKVNGGS